MLVPSVDGEFMRILRSLLLVLALWVLPLTLGGDRAVAVFTCGMFDGTFQCKATSGGEAHGKNASPSVGDTSTPEEAPQGTGEREVTAPAGSTTHGTQGGAREVVQPGEHSCPPGYRVLAAPNASGSYCQPPAG